MKHCDCTQRPKLIQSGWGKGHHTHICPSCKQRWYKKDDKFTKEKPFSWPAQKKDFGVIWEPNKKSK